MILHFAKENDFKVSQASCLVPGCSGEKKVLKSRLFALGLHPHHPRFAPYRWGFLMGLLGVPLTGGCKASLCWGRSWD